METPTLPMDDRPAQVVNVSGTLDRGAVVALAKLLDAHPDRRLLRLDCSGVDVLDPLGSLALARLLDDWSSADRRVEIRGFTDVLRRALQRHPLARFCIPRNPGEDELFREPFGDQEDWRPSRH
jgi:anti-anti-sigma regulatory factor